MENVASKDFFPLPEQAREKMIWHYQTLVNTMMLKNISQNKELIRLFRPNQIQCVSEIRTSLDFRLLSCVPFPESPDFRHCLKSGHFCPNFWHFFCLKSGQKSWDTSLGHFISKNYDPKFPNQPSLVCPIFRQLDCPDFVQKSRNLMSEIGTLQCPDFRHSLYLFINMLQYSTSFFHFRWIIVKYLVHMGCQSELPV